MGSKIERRAGRCVGGWPRRHLPGNGTGSTNVAGPITHKPGGHRCDSSSRHESLETGRPGSLCRWAKSSALTQRCIRRSLRSTLAGGRNWLRHARQALVSRQVGRWLKRRCVCDCCGRRHRAAPGRDGRQENAAFRPATAPPAHCKRRGTAANATPCPVIDHELAKAYRHSLAQNDAALLLSPSPQCKAASSTQSDRRGPPRARSHHA